MKMISYTIFWIKCFIFINMFMMSTRHPINLMILLFFNVSIISIYYLFSFKSSWISMMLILMTNSGLMIIYIYMVSLSPNQKFKLPNIKKIILMMMMVIIANYNNNYIIYINNTINNKYNLYMYMYPHSINMIIMLLVIFYYMLIIMELISKSKAPLQLKY
uniref:NADH dehydrogenase subunit 6 n=1 Tax=Dermanyssus gallinae TaxID=34641 RepID=A0A7U3Q0B2_9ACAR|nr:NADH dehydrogenase subunit 6 [Dermanyssus gallinae]QPG86048.1 NADH dehydrogenase subunit 6 [Dermanyssus gallinae]